MGETPTVGDVRVVLKLDTDEAKKKVAEVEKQLQKNEKDRRNIIDRINKEGVGATSNRGRTGKTVGDKLLDKVLTKTGGHNPATYGGTVGQFFGLPGGSSAGAPSPLTPHQSGLAALKAVAGKVNPFPKGGISGDNVGGIGQTLGLATALYKGLDKGAQYSGLALAYAMKSGDAASKTDYGKFLSELNGTFSYANNYFKSWKDSFSMASEWDSTVAAVTGKLPDTYFYRSKFSRMAQFEREFTDLMSRNAAQTRAGAVGASGIKDQLRDGFFLSMSR